MTTALQTIPHQYMIPKAADSYPQSRTCNADKRYPFRLTWIYMTVAKSGAEDA